MTSRPCDDDHIRWRAEVGKREDVGLRRKAFEWTEKVESGQWMRKKKEEEKAAAE